MNKIYGRIYCVTNTASGKKYIGQTTRSVMERWSQHCRLKNIKYSALQRAIKKYGADGFVVETLCVCSSRVELDERERAYIDELDCVVPNGYNLQAGGNGGRWNDISKVRASRARRLAAATDRRIVDRMITPEAREKRRKSITEKYKDPEFREKIRAVRVEQFSRPETKSKKSRASLMYWADDANRKRQSCAVRTAWLDPEKRLRMSSASVVGKSCPEYRAERSRLTKALWADPEFRAKVAATKAQTRSLREAGKQ